MGANDKSVIARCLVQYRRIFYLFLIFCCYFTCLKAPETSLKNMRNRSSHQRCSIEIGVLKNFTKFTGKRLWQSLFLILKKRLWHRCFPVNFVKFLRAPHLQNTSGGLLLEKIVKYLPYCTRHCAIISTCSLCCPKFVHLLILRGRRGATKLGIRTIFQMNRSDESTSLNPPRPPSSSF